MTISLEDVCKDFGHNTQKLEVLDHVNLEIKEGEFVSLLGPSGCGKSTLLNIIAGLENPSSGKVSVDGQLVKGPGADRVMVFQEAALFPWLTVKDNVLFGLDIKKLPRDESGKLVNEHLKMVHLSRFANAHPHELSGGMRQRVAIARALVMEPKYLLMDEPFGALDEQTRLMLHGDLQQIWLQTRKTIIFVTHNIREAIKLSDRILLMGTRPGRVKKEFRIPLSRPRLEADKNVTQLEALILEDLRDEIEKVMREEVDNDYDFAQDSLPWSPDRDLGSNI